MRSPRRRPRGWPPCGVVLPVVELRSDFSVSRDELRDAERGAEDVDLQGLDESARRIACAENVAVFHGFEQAGIVGITEASTQSSIELSDDFDAYPGHVAKAVELLRRQGIGGPYGLALGPDGYTGVIETTEHGGYLVFDHLGKILDGPIVWAPGCGITKATFAAFADATTNTLMMRSTIRFTAPENDSSR